eukprot:CAMPEP_0183712090 /NCGR_PEP_ID=MMETSP0737-20130205/7340_1 /TAXON_ID=385413 /ORGANISM="Thalassiosira miniscula, Strain CCMP1093" /LENGTH=638 /DNA_ID=CAMNT_0025940667 /DNA_START=1 /DNA_END=1913 /DNA_ORIENTATION=-
MAAGTHQKKASPLKAAGSSLLSQGDKIELSSRLSPGGAMVLEIEEPLLSSSSAAPAESAVAIGTMGPRLLDRDGGFSQSRGRWSVTSSSNRSSAEPRQRRAASAAPAATNATATVGSPPAAVPFGVTQQPPTPSVTRHSSERGSCFCKSKDQPNLGRRCWDDWFHTVSHTPTCILMGGIFVAYFVTIVIFAGLYLTVNKVGEYYGEDSTNGDGGGAAYWSVESSGGSDVDVPSFCGMDINNHMEALYFSLSTMATIGYGTSDYYFGDCWTPFILVLFQVFSAIVFSSLAIGLLFQRMSRGQKRGRTIVFSDVAVIRKVRGRWYWMFRVAELRKRHIIGATVRVFCVRHERCPVATRMTETGEVESRRSEVVELETAYFVSHPLPLLNGSHSTTTSSGGRPSSSGANEEEPHSECSFEQAILMGLPHVIVHRMDSLSPMMPPRPIWYDEAGVPHGSAPSPLATLSEAPTERASEESTEQNNAATSTLMATAMEEGAAPNSLLDHYSGSSLNQPTQDEITHFLQDRQAEIIVCLEGTCEVTGMALQARHSYRMEDIAFHQTFAPCVFPAASIASANKRKWWNPFSKKSKAKVDQDLKPRGSSGGEVYTFQNNTALEIDFGQFHDLLPVPYDSMSCPYIPS